MPPEVERLGMEEEPISEAWRIPDALWEQIEPLLPKRKRRRFGRPPIPQRRIFDGIYYVLRTGCQWKATPPEFSSGSTLHRWFQRWVQKGVFKKLWQAGLLQYDKLKHIKWKWQSIDGAMTKAPLGGEKDGPKPYRSSQIWNEEVPSYRWRRRASGSDGERSQHTRQASCRTDA